MKRPIVQAGLLFVLLLGLTLAMTWPLALHMSDHVVSAAYFWDAYTNTMLMGARARTVLGIGPGGIYEDYFFAPIGHTLAFNENLFGLSLLFLPFYALTHNPLLSYNLVLLLSLTLSACFALLLVRRVTGSGLAGMLAGVAFAFCPYAFFEMGRIQLVATQWIPLFFFFLHRVAERKRLRDLAGVGFAYAMQVGTCLYYAMFMLPLGVLFGALLFARNRPFSRRFVLHAGAVASVTAGLIASMVFPYFAARKKFGLTRSEDFAQDFDGKLSFLFHVHPTNKLLTFLHHLPMSEEGAHEEVAFPGFTLVLLTLVALVVGLLVGLRQVRPRMRMLGACYVLVNAGLALGLVLVTHSMLTGALVIAGVAVLWARLLPGVTLLSPRVSPWFWLLLLALTLFLGFTPLAYHGKMVHGLYYYLHTYVPGFNGIRKVSRQAVMVALGFAVLGGLGAADLFARVRRTALRHTLFGALLLGLLLELRNAPLELTSVPAGATVPSVYRFIARQKGHAPIAVIPTSWGQQRFVGPRGLALHNYLALFHGRRTINGKSSWIPPITHLFNRTSRNLPNDAALRVLQILHPQFLVVHAGDLDPGFASRLLENFERRPAVLKRVYQDGDDFVYELQKDSDPTLGLLSTPVLDEQRLERIDRRHIGITASRASRQAVLALDGDPTTKWTTGRPQAVGDFVELTLDQPREIAALELTDYELTFDAPPAFKLEASEDGRSYRTVFVRPRIRIYSDQIYHPKHFSFRVKLPAPVHARHLRLTLLEGFPQRYFTIYEVQLWGVKP
jgi:hypothetical protein